MNKRAHIFLPWIVWGLGASLFFAQYLGRIAPGVMVPELMHDFQVTALSLGTLSAFFYLAYVSLQVPVGMLVDRYGPRLLLPVMGGVYVGGCLLFSAASQVGYAEMGRFLMGLGAAFTFVSTLKLATSWFPANRIGFLAGMTQALGMIGAAVGRAPVSYAVSSFGWRITMMGIAIICTIIVSLIICFVRNRPEKTLPGTISASFAAPLGMWAGLFLILRNPQTWLNAAFVGLLYAPTAAFAELWGVAYLTQTYPVSNHEAAFAVGLIFIGWGVGGPIAGWFSDYIQRRRVMMLGSAALSGVLMFSIIYVPNLHVWAVYLLLFLYGLANTGVAVSYAVAAEINPHRVAGTSMAFANMSSVMIGAAFQPLIGWLVDLHWNKVMANGAPLYTSQDFSFALSALPVCFVLAFLVAFFIKETYCQPSCG